MPPLRHMRKFDKFGDVSDDISTTTLYIDSVFKIVSISVDIDGIAIGLGTGDNPSNYILHYDGMRIHELEVVTV